MHCKECLWPPREKVTGDWRKRHNGYLHYCTDLQLVFGWSWHAARTGEKTEANWVLEAKAKGKRPVGRLTCRWENTV